MNNGRPDKITLLGVIKDLCTKQIRAPLNMEQAKSWLRQFSSDEEQFLGLLILRYLVYRTGPQLDSSLRQALKAAAFHFLPNDHQKPTTSWSQILNGGVKNLKFMYGPLKSSRPGKSGEIIARRLKSCASDIKFDLKYYSDIDSLEAGQKYLIVDDGTFTGSQLGEFLGNDGSHLVRDGQCGIVVGLAHQTALDFLRKNHPNVPVFSGELLTTEECFEAACKNWVNEEIWPYRESNPFEIYMEISKRAKFDDRLPLGFGDLGCMVAYEHGIPDNSLQLLWGESKTWNPLIKR